MRKICVVSGSRAEYGQLYRLLTRIQGDSRLELQLVVTGMHLSEEYGSTVDAVVEDGFKITASIETIDNADVSESIATEVAKGLVGIADYLKRERPEFVVVLGDRYEILPAAISALFLKIPLVHICGGEKTDGSLDDSIRHSITKMAQIHFVSDETYRHRVIQLGEEPAFVLNFGDLRIENIRKTNPKSRRELVEEYGRQILNPYLLVTYHPETANPADPSFGANRIVEVLELFPDHSVVVTGSNSDKGGKDINRIFKEFCKANPEKAIFATNLGRENYISVMHHCDAVVGNSSSGVVEAPAIGIPTVNIGNRQSGRLMQDSVLSCGDSVVAIADAIKLAISEEFRTRCRRYAEVVPITNTAEKMTDYLATADPEFRRKSFFDLQ